MAKSRNYSSKKSGSASRAQNSIVSSAAQESMLTPASGPDHFTGRYLVIHRDIDSEEGLNRIADIAGLSDIANSEDFPEGAVDFDEVAEADGIHFRQLGISVYQGDPKQLNALASMELDQGPVEEIVPERYVFVEADPLLSLGGGGGSLSLDYLRGYRDSLSALIDQLSEAELDGQALVEAAAEMAATYQDTAQATWGLQATRVLRGNGSPLSRYTGRGVRVAILDTGLDLNHPDFQGRSISQRTFVAQDRSVQDMRGHGTHVAGTACGPRPYGVAPQADLFIGKVFPANGGAPDGAILAGINWAIDSGCQVVNLSLGLQTGGAPPDRLYERVGRRALDAGTLLIAAAGNDSNRPGQLLPVAQPANSKNILAVAAVDSALRIAGFSNGGLSTRDGGEIDLAAPGIDIYSSFPLPIRFRRMPGTSMAAPHVAGIAALYSEANGGIGGKQLWQLLSATTRRLNLPRRDVGEGLAQAPD